MGKSLSIHSSAADDKDVLHIISGSKSQRPVKVLSNENVFGNGQLTLARQNNIEPILERAKFGRDRFPGFPSHDYRVAFFSIAHLGGQIPEISHITRQLPQQSAVF